MCKAAVAGPLDLSGLAIVIIFGGLLAALSVWAWRKATRAAALSAAIFCVLLAVGSLALRPDTIAPMPTRIATLAYLFVGFGLTWTLVLPAAAWGVSALLRRRPLTHAALALSLIPVVALVVWYSVYARVDPCSV